MTLSFNTLQRSIAFGVLCILAIVYVVATSSDETHLGKTALTPPRSPEQSVLQHAVTSGFRVMRISSENATITIQTKAIYQARSAFLLMAYTFLRKVYTDQGCATIDSIRLYPFGYQLNANGTHSLRPFAEIIIERSGAKEIDWSQAYPNLSAFHKSLKSHGTIRYDKNSVP
jgi:hypothetical protein